MSLNLVELVRLKYPGEIEQGNVMFRQPEQNGDILIYNWNISGVAQPTENELLSEIPAYQQQYDFEVAYKKAQKIIEDTLNKKAKEKKYASALSLATYVTSTNLLWAADAQAFVAWRDRMYEYAIASNAQMISSGIIPSEQDFISGMPAFQWPV